MAFTRAKTAQRATSSGRHGVDSLFGSNSQRRAIAEVCACDDAKHDFARDFASAFGKVMELDRFDLA